MIRLLVIPILALASFSFAQEADTIVQKEPKIGSVLRTVRPIDMTNDTADEILQVETTKARKVDDIKVRFGIWQGSKRIYSDEWKAKDYFDAKDKLPDSVKWRRLRRIITYFFSNQNFTKSEDESLASMLERLQAVDLRPGTPEAEEFSSSSHRMFSVYAGRDYLYGITYLYSKRKFVRVWRN
jgi:hypothetical protein